MPIQVLLRFEKGIGARFIRIQIRVPMGALIDHALESEAGKLEAFQIGKAPGVAPSE